MGRLIKKVLSPLMIQEGPSYINKFYYSLGFLSATSFVILIISGVIMALFGPDWWLTSVAGEYLRSVHMWATQAFVIFIILHLLIGFFTSAFKKPRGLTWVLGSLMLLFVLLESEFGFVLRGDYSSQWRSLQGADFYNGSGIGYWLNPLNYKQVYGIHIVAVPLLIIGLLFLHYLLIRVLGIAKPYRKDISAKTVPANHKVLFARGVALVVAVMGLAFMLPSPYVRPTTIQSVAEASPRIMATSLVKEFDGSSDTATYKDNIAPYTYNTRQAYIYGPYTRLSQTEPPHSKALITAFMKESSDIQSQQLKDAAAFFGTWDGKHPIQTSNPVIVIVDRLVTMAQAGLYEPALNDANNTAKPGDSTTHTLRFLSDSGVLLATATDLKMTTAQYGMIREESGHAPGAWWLAPIGLLNHTVLKDDSNGDRDGAVIFGCTFLLLIAFPFIPLVNQIPDKLKIYKIIWHQKKR